MPETVDQQSHADEVDSTTTYCRGNVKQWPEEKAEQPSLDNCVLLVDHTEFSCEEGDGGSTYNWSAFSAPVVASRIKNLASDPTFREQVSKLPHYQVSHAKDVEELQIRMEDLMSRSEGGKKATADLIRLIREEYPEAAIYGDVDEETWHRVQNDGETQIYTAHYPIHGHSDDRGLCDLGPEMSPPTSHDVSDLSILARETREQSPNHPSRMTPLQAPKPSLTLLAPMCPHMVPSDLLATFRVEPKCRNQRGHTLKQGLTWRWKVLDDRHVECQRVFIVSASNSARFMYICERARLARAGNQTLCLWALPDYLKPKSKHLWSIMTSLGAASPLITCSTSLMSIH